MSQLKRYFSLLLVYLIFPMYETLPNWSLVLIVALLLSLWTKYRLPKSVVIFNVFASLGLCLAHFKTLIDPVFVGGT
jgi:hypothetical protein